MFLRNSKGIYRLPSSWMLFQHQTATKKHYSVFDIRATLSHIGGFFQIVKKYIYNVKVKIVQSKFLWKDLLILFQPVKFWSINKLSKKKSYWEKYQLRNMSSPESRGIRMSVPSPLHKFTVPWKVDDNPYCL